MCIVKLGDIVTTLDQWMDIQTVCVLLDDIVTTLDQWMDIQTVCVLLDWRTLLLHWINGWISKLYVYC